MPEAMSAADRDTSGTIEVVVNGERHRLPRGSTCQDAVDAVQPSGPRLAVERNEEIVPRSRWAECTLEEGDRLEIVQAIGGGAARSEMSTRPEHGDPLFIAGRRYHSRLLVGTGKYRDSEQTVQAVEASGAEIVTVALRRSNIGQQPDEPNLLDLLPPSRFTILPNTAGCYTVRDAIRTCELARELLDGHTLVKLEVLGDERTLYPDIPATLDAARELVAAGFDVMAYTSDDPVTARRLEEIGCVAVMPLAAPIGSGLGIQNPYNIREIVSAAGVPVLVDAGVGTASDAAVAMELGCDAVLMNTAIAGARDPVLMARAMRKGVEAGREALLAGRIPRRDQAVASSPTEGTFFQ